MNKLMENKWIRLVVYLLVIIAVSLIIFPLLDYLYTLITNNSFTYSIHDHVQQPIMYGVILGIISWVMSFESKKDDSKGE